MVEVTILGWRDALLGFRDKKDGIFNIFTVSSRLSFISLFLPSSRTSLQSLHLWCRLYGAVYSEKALCAHDVCWH